MLVTESIELLAAKPIFTVTSGGHRYRRAADLTHCAVDGIDPKVIVGACQRDSSTSRDL